MSLCSHRPRIHQSPLKFSLDSDEARCFHPTKIEDNSIQQDPNDPPRPTAAHRGPRPFTSGPTVRVPLVEAVVAVVATATGVPLAALASRASLSLSWEELVLVPSHLVGLERLKMAKVYVTLDLIKENWMV